jgi:membrane fusion protein (multidrug efflux system)
MILSAVGVIGVVTAVYFVYDHLVYVSTDNAQIDAHSLMIAAKVGGFITKVNVDDGSKVKKGDILAEIDDRDYNNALTEIRGQLVSSEAERHDAERTYNRLAQLYKSNAVSQQQFDTATTQFSQAKAKYDAVSAQVAQAELNLANTKIVAPSNGVIAKRSAEIGQLAAPGIPLFGFVDADERWVTANFKETEISDIRIGSQAQIDVDAVDGKSYKGHVVAISSATGSTFTLLPPDNATGNFTKVVQRVPVKIVFDNMAPDDMDALRAGLSTLVKVKRH